VPLLFRKERTRKLTSTGTGKPPEIYSKVCRSTLTTWSGRQMILNFLLRFVKHLWKIYHLIYHKLVCYIILVMKCRLNLCRTKAQILDAGLLQPICRQYCRMASFFWKSVTQAYIFHYLNRCILTELLICYRHIGSAFSDVNSFVIIAEYRYNYQMLGFSGQPAGTTAAWRASSQNLLLRHTFIII